MNYNNIIDCILFPEKTEPITFPIINYPTKSVKLTNIITDFIDSSNNIIFYPGLLESDLIVNDKKYTNSKYTYMMDQYFVYACSITILGDRIYTKNKIYEDDIRVIYQPLNLWAIDNETIYSFRVKNLKEIKICRHIQFIPHAEYKEIFNLNILPDTDETLTTYIKILNDFKYNPQTTYMHPAISGKKYESDEKYIIESKLKS